MNIFDRIILKIGDRMFQDESEEENPQQDKTVTWFTPDKATYYKMFEEMYNNSSHILVAGTTGSGKSVFINSFIYSLLAFCAPVSGNGAKFVLIDPKRVELSKYKKLPHTIRYACDNEDIIDALYECIELMEQRYIDMEEAGIVKSNETPIYIVIDELADLMTTCKKDIMPLLQRIAQLGRAANVRLLCATQAPNRKIIPAELTTNFNTRIGLHCFSPIESKQIIGTNGAETLPQYGQAIIRTASYVRRSEVPMVSDEKLKERIAYWENAQPIIA